MKLFIESEDEARELIGLLDVATKSAGLTVASTTAKWLRRIQEAAKVAQDRKENAILETLERQTREEMRSEE
ncbi:MAG: hypothetical protein OEU26_26580 [Candidatus Tectomicrobia bacterium]|nr:hypothetical protein [Candidatus Tectomicrobia bacterium]